MSLLPSLYPCYSQRLLTVTLRTGAEGTGAKGRAGQQRLGVLWWWGTSLGRGPGSSRFIQGVVESGGVSGCFFTSRLPLEKTGFISVTEARTCLPTKSTRCIKNPSLHLCLAAGAALSSVFSYVSRRFLPCRHPFTPPRCLTCSRLLLGSAPGWFGL